MAAKILLSTLATVVIASTPYPSARSQNAIVTEKLYQTEIDDVGAVEAALLAVKMRQEELLVVAAQNGTVVGIDPPTGAELWRARVPTPSGERPEINATPSKVGKLLFVSYLSRSDSGRQRHLVAAIDLNAGNVATQYQILELNATKTNYDGATIAFNPPTALSRAALVNAGRSAITKGKLYVSFGNPQDIQPWHGWIFEIDIDAWRQEGAGAAISSVLLTTPESDCPDPGHSGSTDMICGGGIWNPSGPQVVQRKNGYDLLVTTGNGELNLNSQNYAQSVLRLTKGLVFEPECDPDRCAAFDPISPSEACLSSCKNIAIPRLMPDDPPLQVASGRCDGKTFLECLAANDWDLGANGAAQIKLGLGKRVIVQPGKDGALYLFDAKRMGVMYDRDQIVATCGTSDDPCGSWSAGMMRTQPLVTNVNGNKIVIVSTFMPDDTQPAGLVARRIGTEDGEPQFEPMWEAPDFDLAEATERFRGYPSLPFLTTAPNGDSYVWIVDTTGEQDTLIGVRVADGTIVVRQPLQGTVNTVRPGHRNGIIYVTSGGGILEAFRIRY